jgi:hypothetical protein
MALKGATCGLRIYAGDDGGFRFEDVELPASRTHIVDGVPPLLVSGPFACTGVPFVAQPQDASDWQAHVAPRKQWVFVLSGRAMDRPSTGVLAKRLCRTICRTRATPHAPLAAQCDFCIDR